MGNKANKNKNKLAKDAGRRRHVKRLKDRQTDKYSTPKQTWYPPGEQF